MTDLSDLQVSSEPLFTGASAAYPYSDALARKFTVESRFGDVYTLFHQQGDKILLPREVCPLSSDDRREVGPPAQFFSKVIARDAEQKRLIDEASALLGNGESFVLEAGTGTGKTVIATELIARVGRKTLFIAPKDDLLDNAADAFKQFLGLRASQIGLIKANVFDVQGKDIVIASLKSLAVKEYPGWLRNEFGLVIWDEMHRIPAETFSRTAMMFSAKLRLGLSATPDRVDGKEVLAYANIGPVRVRSKRVMMTPTIGIYQSPWKIPMNYGKPISHKPGKCGHVLNMLAEDEGRNLLITSKVLAGYKKNRKTVVFSDRLEHLRRLAFLARANGVDPKDVAMYVSGLKKDERERAKTKPLIFATYGMMGEGTDIPWLDLCILATPRSNVKQPVGRVLREHPGKPTPVVIDIVDWSSHVFRGYAERRLEFYKSVGADIKTY